MLDKRMPGAAPALTERSLQYGCPKVVQDRQRHVVGVVLCRLHVEPQSLWELAVLESSIGL